MWQFVGPRWHKKNHDFLTMKEILGVQVSKEPMPKEFDTLPQRYNCLPYGHVAK